MGRLNAQQLKYRGEIINRMIENHGEEKVIDWLSDNDKLLVINALAAVYGKE